MFTELAEDPLSQAELTDRHDHHPEIAADFLDALVALDLLERNEGVYRNAADTDRFLDRNKETYIDGHLEWANTRMYPLFGNFTETLRTRKPQAAHGDDVFDELYVDDDLFERFIAGMSGMSSRVAEILAESFDWENDETLCDVGASKGVVPVIVAEKNDAATAFDLPPLEPVPTEFIANSDSGSSVLLRRKRLRGTPRARRLRDGAAATRLRPRPQESAYPTRPRCTARGQCTSRVRNDDRRRTLRKR